VPSDPDQLRAWIAERSLEISPFDNPEIALPDPPDEIQALTVTVALQEPDPPIWRRIVVAGDTRLDRLHDILQVTMGWTDSHLHRFYPGTDDRGPYFVTDEDLDEGEEGTDESTVRLDQLLREVGDHLLYDYDFGDGWSHVVRLEDAEPLSGELPRCIGGERACPPEDIGGIFSYGELVDWYDADRPADALPPQFDSLEDLTAWLPADFDPVAFDHDDVNLRLRAEAAAEALVMSIHPELALLLGQLDPSGMAAAHAALSGLPDRAMTDDELVEATRHYQVLLDAIGDGVTLTGAGYLPPAVVSVLFEQLHLEARWFGKGNREDHTPPIHTCRLAATQLGLLRKAKGSLTPTAAAMRVAGNPAALFAHVASRLPLGRPGIEQEAGWFALLGLAGNTSRSDHGRFASTMLTARGWETAGRPLADYEAYGLLRPTVAALTGPTQEVAREWSPWVQLAAAAIVRPRTRA
jgi:hypothetical protein